MMNDQAVLFRVGGLGDLLVALPAISLVRRGLPGARLTLVGRADYTGLLKRAGVVDEVVAFDDARMSALFADDGASGAGTRPLAEFDFAFGWLNHGGDWPAAEWWLRQGIGQTFFAAYERGAGVPMSRFFFDRTREHFRTAPNVTSDVAPSVSGGATGPRASADADTVRRSNLDAPFDECARLTFGRDLREKALESLHLRALETNEKRLVIHPGSGGCVKRWPLDNFIDVIGRAASLGLKGVLVTGEAEADIEAELKEFPLPAGWARASRLPAETLAGLLAESTHYIGNDSGPTHLAAACGALVLALFREDNLPAWRPFGRTRVLSSPAVDRIPLAAVLAGLGDFLAA
jgi:hypothetical protein